jgi:taurine dioxygenase
MSTSPPDQSGVSGVGNVIQRLAALHRTGETVPRDRSSFAWGPGEAVRWRWTEGDLVIWDGACTLHRALVDHHPSIRRMRRCTIDGDRPRSVSRA